MSTVLSSRKSNEKCAPNEGKSKLQYLSCPPSRPLLYLPLFCRRTVRVVQPCLYVMVETDIWPNLVRLMNSPCVLASGYASPRSFPRAFWGAVFRHIDLFLMQTDQDAENMKRRGALPDRVKVGGNLKFDGCGGENRSLPASSR